MPPHPRHPVNALRHAENRSNYLYSIDFFSCVWYNEEIGSYPKFPSRRYIIYDRKIWFLLTGPILLMDPVILTVLKKQKWSRVSDLNWRPAAYKAAALPTELTRLNNLILPNLAKNRNLWYNECVLFISEWYGLCWNRLVAMTRDCKSLGFGLRRFESYFQHQERHPLISIGSRGFFSFVPKLISTWIKVMKWSDILSFWVNKELSIIFFRDTYLLLKEYKYESISGIAAVTTNWTRFFDIYYNIYFNYRFHS